MENNTFNSPILQLEGLKIQEDSVHLVFFLFLFSYIVFMIMNLGILAIIFMEKNLHQPMYVLFCNLTISDIIGSTHILPRLLSDILLPPAERLIGYYECVVQAFITHMFGTTSHTVLMVMAFDRYVAICHPLHYSTIMTRKIIVQLIVFSWGAPFVLVLFFRFAAAAAGIFDRYGIWMLRRPTTGLGTKQRLRGTTGGMAEVLGAGRGSGEADTLGVCHGVGGEADALGVCRGTGGEADALGSGRGAEGEAASQEDDAQTSAGTPTGYPVPSSAAQEQAQ
ncbi:PREDICTED: olfactory receptor 1496-like [Cyprinodon variegatus]|uniref:olfactory receptor 1496-like n=1 Tax=Cyprinodon variegatus TaxID=28743 RepID=UPI0007427CBE|nr:PREDICTED: olfactory receptor 1496-like [Cyprinodon variegatus]